MVRPGRRGIAWLAAGVAAAVLAVPAGAGAAPAISFVAPAGALSYPDAGDGPVGYTAAPSAFRTADARPVIGIEADGGTQLVCHPDSVWVDQPCGGALPGCSAQICASYQPPSPLEPDGPQYATNHFLAVDLEDADGDAVASYSVTLDVDTTPPVTHLDSQGGILSTDSASTGLRHQFTYTVTDDNAVGGRVDRIECSWSPAAQAPAWHACGSAGGPGGGASLSGQTGRLARRHRAYLVQVRATDDLGRSSTASALYDPVPCVVSFPRPRNVGRLAASGLPVRVTCDAIRNATVALYTYALNGRRFVPPRDAPLAYRPLSTLHLTSRGTSLDVRRRMRLSRSARRYLRRWRSAGLVVAAGHPGALRDGVPDDTVSYHTFTLRR